MIKKKKKDPYENYFPYYDENKVYKDNITKYEAKLLTINALTIMGIEDKYNEQRFNQSWHNVLKKHG